MKSIVFILIVYIGSAIKCEVNKTEDAIKQEIEEDNKVLQRRTTKNNETMEFILINSTTHPKENVMLAKQLQKTFKAKDVLKFLQRHKKTHPEESVKLTKQLRELMDDNITELRVDINDSEFIPSLSSEVSGNSSNIGRRRPKNDGFEFIKKTILAHLSVGKKQPEETTAQKFEKSVQKGREFMAKFIKKYNITFDWIE